MQRLLRYPFALECGVYITTYEQDHALHQTPLAVARGWVLVALLYAIPWFLPNYYVSILNMVAIYTIAALGLNLLTGVTGQISVGHGAFTGMGAFTVGYLMKQGLPFWVAMPLAGLTAAAVGALFGLPSARLKGLYLAIASLAAQVILTFFFTRADWFTGGIHSMSVRRPSFFGHTLSGERSYFYLALTVALLLGVFAQNLLRTRIGRAFMAVRDRDLAAEVMGIDLFRTKVTAFALSAFYAGIAGAIWAPYVMIISPEQFEIHLSIELLAMIIIGGMGSVMGSVYGAAFMTVMPIVVRELAMLLEPVFPSVGTKLLLIRDAAFGAAIVLFLIFEPEGLAKLWRNIKDYFRLWPFGYSKS
ncbi:branched-chain amino acid ABC transporter permease [Symbiobacterium thermophilum]|uniref:branched-chain amino acid ABC transporter permease n=2 Tax=Symbiobacterium thermophilum TaxID=2734 RepID=UPI000306E36C|nr:branched-chain amino acid ABC transporter permease [Symbiobacterium thermophilum]